MKLEYRQLPAYRRGWLSPLVVREDAYIFLKYANYFIPNLLNDLIFREIRNHNDRRMSASYFNKMRNNLLK